MTLSARIWAWRYTAEDRRRLAAARQHYAAEAAWCMLLGALGASQPSRRGAERVRMISHLRDPEGELRRALHRTADSVIASSDALDQGDEEAFRRSLDALVQNVSLVRSLAKHLSLCESEP